jgi:hypothetical protein
VPSLVAPSLTGHLIDTAGSTASGYTTGFLVTAAVMLLTGAFAFPRSGRRRTPGASGCDQRHMRNAGHSLLARARTTIRDNTVEQPGRQSLPAGRSLMILKAHRSPWGTGAVTGPSRPCRRCRPVHEHVIEWPSLAADICGEAAEAAGGVQFPYISQAFRRAYHSW